MPRVKLAGDTYRDKDLTQLIRRYQFGMALTNTDAGKLIGCCEKTWRNYMDKPSAIPLGKLRMIQKKLRIPADEMLPHVLGG